MATTYSLYIVFVLVLLLPETTAAYSVGFHGRSRISSAKRYEQLHKPLKNTHVLRASIVDDYIQYRKDDMQRYRRNHKPNISSIVFAIHKFILKSLAQVSHQFRNKCIPLIISMAILLSIPMQSSASSSSSLDSSSYYLQNNPQYSTPIQRKQALSIQTQSSQPSYTTSTTDSSYKALTQRSNSGYIGQKRKQSVKRISTLVILSTFAASSFRASLRKKRVVRNISPFGRIRNASALGNGVSVIRVCMALAFDNTDEGNANADSLLKRLHIEEQELQSKLEMLSQLQGQFISNTKTKILGEYTSNVASTLLQHNEYMKFGSLDSMRVPFVEEATRAFQEGLNEEQSMLSNASSAQEPNQPSNENRYILATVLLAIKGDRTSITLPFGIIRRRDVAFQLFRISRDSTVDDCLVSAQLMTMPSISTGGCQSSISEEGILKAFPDLVPLT